MPAEQILHLPCQSLNLHNFNSLAFTCYERKQKLSLRASNLVRKLPNNKTYFPRLRLFQQFQWKFSYALKFCTAKTLEFIINEERFRSSYHKDN